MNYIVLEGISLFVVIIMIIVLLIVSLCSLIFVMMCDKRVFALEQTLADKNEEIKILNRENLMFKIKCGELDIDEE